MNSHKPRIALLGNPNVGKTAVFNLLTGLDQKVSNYPGITVEKKTTQFKLSQNHKSKNIIIEDFPGSYSNQLSRLLHNRLRDRANPFLHPAQSQIK